VQVNQGAIGRAYPGWGIRALIFREGRGELNDSATYRRRQRRRALIGWVGGETIVSDVALKDTLAANPWLHYAGAAAGAIVVYVIGKALQRRGQSSNAPA